MEMFKYKQLRKGVWTPNELSQGTVKLQLKHIYIDFVMFSFHQVFRNDSY